MTTNSTTSAVDETPRYQVRRQRIIGGKKYNSGAFVTDDDIPDHEWGEQQRSDDFCPPLPRRKPLSQETRVESPEPAKEEVKTFDFNPRIADEPDDE